MAEFWDWLRGQRGRDDDVGMVARSFGDKERPEIKGEQDFLGYFSDSFDEVRGAAREAWVEWELESGLVQQPAPARDPQRERDRLKLAGYALAGLLVRGEMNLLKTASDAVAYADAVLIELGRTRPGRDE